MLSSKDILKDIANHHDPEHLLITNGYTGWEAGQIEQIAHNNWLVTPADTQIMFNTPIEHRWVAAAQQLGVDGTSASASRSRINQQA